MPIRVKVQLVSDHAFSDYICPKKPMIFYSDFFFSQQMAASINQIYQTRAVLSREQEISNVLKTDNVKENILLVH